SVKFSRSTLHQVGRYSPRFRSIKTRPQGQDHIPGRQRRPHGPSFIFSGLRERQCAVPQGMDHPQVDGRTKAQRCALSRYS
ncbi:hypothetical protein AB205_0152020, partial [Aquarana catesbeiana]